MNIEMRVDGYLAITPETPTEHYALQHWAQKYPPRNNSGILIKALNADDQLADQWPAGALEPSNEPLVLNKITTASSPHDAAMQRKAYPGA